MARFLTLALWLYFSLPTYAQSEPGRSSWARLSPQEKQILAPLAKDWDRMGAAKKTKMAWRHQTLP